MDILDLGKKVLKAQAFSELLGAELTVFEAGRAELQLELQDRLKQQNGFAHGGVLSYLADNAITFAGGTALGPSVLTQEMKINYVRPAKGERLIARADVLSAGKRQAVCRCEVYVVANGEEKLCAAAQGTILSTAE